MKHSLSKLSIALAAAGLCISTAGFASVTHKPVGVPSCGAQYRIGVTGFWVRSMNDSLDYALTGAENGSSVSLHSHAVEHDYDFAFDVHGAFMLNDSGNDLAANYTYLNSDADDTTASTNGVQAGGGETLIGDANVLKGESEFTFNEFNVEIGQLVDFCQLHTRFHFGLSYAQIEHDFTIKGSHRADNEVVYNDEVGVAKLESKFAGIGPRVGVDMNYPINNCSNFSIVAHATGSLLTGQLERDAKASSQSYQLTEGGVVPVEPAQVFNAKADDVYTVVPAGSLKVGVRYGSVQEPGACGWAVEAGWHAAGYLHSVATPIGGNSSFSNAGFYLTFDYAG